MNKLIKTKLQFNVRTLLIGMTIIYCVVFPADKLNIKEIILLAALLVNLPCIYSFVMYNSSGSRLAFFSLIFPFFLTLYAVLRGVSLSGTLSFGYVWIYLLLIPPIVISNIDIKQPFIFATIVVAIIIDSIYLMDVFGLLSIYANPLVDFFYSMNELQYGKGALSTFGYSIFYKSSPLLYLTYVYMLKNNRYRWVPVILLALIASGTRANFLIGLFLTAIVPTLESENINKKLAFTIIIICLSIVIVPSIVERISQLNTLKQTRSDDIKIEEIRAIIDILNERPINFILGTGVGSEFFFSVRGTYVSVVEVSYFDYFRQVGIVGILIFTIFLLHPIKRYVLEHKWVLLGYLAYLATAFTNPLLVTSTAFMVYILIYSGAFLEKRESLI